MHRCCPTCCPDHVSQTCTLQCPKVPHWRVSKVFHRWNSSSLILLQQRRQNNPLEEQVSERESLRKVIHLLEGSCRCKSLHIWGEESEKWRILPSVCQEEEEDWKKPASRPPFYTLSSPAVSIWLLLCRQCVRALFQASRNVLWSKQKESAHCLWITSLPKKQQRPIFSQKTPLSFRLHLITGAKTIIIIKKKKKKRPPQSRRPRGIQSGSAGSFRAAEKVSL